MAFENCSKFSKENQKAKAITNKIIEFMVLDNQPFPVVENQGFRRLTAHLDPRFFSAEPLLLCTYG